MEKGQVSHFLKKIGLVNISLIAIFAFQSCEKEYNTILDNTGAAPIILESTFSPVEINTDTINISSERKPSDLLTIKGTGELKVYHINGKNAIKQVVCHISTEIPGEPLNQTFLHDDGIFPDKIPNDSIYSGIIEFQFYRSYVGTLWVSFYGISTTGYQSASRYIPVKIQRLNKPPIISNLSAPDTVIRPSCEYDATEFNIFIKVIDPDGQDDIKSVLRFTPSGKIIFFEPVNDSIYRDGVYLTCSTLPGSYTFRFLAVDRSNDTSNILYKSIVVKD